MRDLSPERTLATLPRGLSAAETHDPASSSTSENHRPFRDQSFMRSKIVVAGALAQKPHQGGHTWVLLQYLLGFRRLGWDVLFLDRLEPGMCADEDGRACPAERSVQLRYFGEVMRRFGLAGTFAVLVREGGSERFLGLDRARVHQHVRDAELLLNVMGYFDDEELLAASRKRVFLDIDPGFGQMWRELGTADVFAGHDAFVTIGRNLGQPGCAIPDCGLEWIATRPPVVLERWPEWPPCDGPFTTVGTWRGRYAPIEYRGQTYGLRVHQFRRFASLPQLCAARFELALDIDDAEHADLALLAKQGWILADPRRVAADPWSYQGYIARSGAELQVPKDVYVRSNSGWFSDRSICYLASGRPVVTRDTGFSRDLPVGEGLLAFEDLESAREAVERATKDRVRHSRAARRIAEECFDSDRVLGELLGRLEAA